MATKSTSDADNPKSPGNLSGKRAQKVFAGPRVRRLRREQGLTQAAMAEQLGISASYLNLVERNQRPVSAQLLLKLADSFDLDIRELSGDDEARAFAELNEVFADPLFQNAGLSRQDVQDVAAASPSVADAIRSLYQAYREQLAGQGLGLGPVAPTDIIADRDKSDHLDVMKFPVEEVRDYIHANRNHFGELDDAAEALNDYRNFAQDELYIGLRRHLDEAHGLSVKVMPVEVLGATTRRFDRHSRRILLSEVLDGPARTFQLAYQIAYLEQADLIERTVKASSLQGEETLRLARISLANYFAAALIMPYTRFHSAAEDSGYDIELLARRFGTSFEQTCHRLTTLQRAGERGIPFFLIRVDGAGNVSKRFAAAGFHFSRYGGTCPRWNLHDAFRTPGKIITQIVQLPDDTTYFSIARTVRRPGAGVLAPEQELAVGLGCEISEASRLRYARAYDLQASDAVTPIGVNCRLCERPDCAERAFPPINRKLIVDEQARGLSSFTFQNV
jgi:predicted transcriptional regulator/DNA-binding XRE family transcriptional regulator